MTTTLLDAVDALTLRWHVDVRDEDGKLIKRARQKPRLEQLADAITQSSGRGGGKSLARERSLIDGHAAQMLADYRRQINDAARGLQVPAGDPIPTLRAWYAASLAKVTTDEWQQSWTGTLERWAREIDDKINPPTSETYPVACPMCEAAFWRDPQQDNSQVKWPLRARYWDEWQHGRTDAEASCLACGARWYGTDVVIQLRDAVLDTNRIVAETVA